MGGSLSSHSASSIAESIQDHTIQWYQSTRLLCQQAFIQTNEVCSNSICECIWPRRWRELAEEADIHYLPVGLRNANQLDGNGEVFQYNRNENGTDDPIMSHASIYREAHSQRSHPSFTTHQHLASSHPPMPYLSQPRDRALYAIDDEDESMASASPTSLNGHYHVPHYSYRNPFIPNTTMNTNTSTPNVPTAAASSSSPSSDLSSKTKSSVSSSTSSSSSSNSRHHDRSHHRSHHKEGKSDKKKTSSSTTSNSLSSSTSSPSMDPLQVSFADSSKPNSASISHVPSIASASSSTSASPPTLTSITNDRVDIRDLIDSEDEDAVVVESPN